MDISISKRVKNKENIRSLIVNTAIPLFLSQGFESTTMEQIALMADVAKRTLYNHFPNKEAIITEYMKLAIINGKSRLNQILSNPVDTSTRLLTVLKEINQWNEANKEILKMHTSYKFKDFLSPTTSNINEHSFESTLLQIMKKGQEDGDLRQDIQIEQLVMYFNALYVSYFIKWLFSEDKCFKKKDLQDIVEFFLEGARRRPS